MSAARKNSKALKGLRRMGVRIDGNFRMPWESACQFPSVAKNSVMYDLRRMYCRIDPMIARRIVKRGY